MVVPVSYRLVPTSGRVHMALQVQRLRGYRAEQRHIAVQSTTPRQTNQRELPEGPGTTRMPVDVNTSQLQVGEAANVDWHAPVAQVACCSSMR
jgi:hypothetical protein